MCVGVFEFSLKKKKRKKEVVSLHRGTDESFDFKNVG